AAAAPAHGCAEGLDLAQAVLDVETEPPERLHQRLGVERLARMRVQEAQQLCPERRLHERLEAPAVVTHAASVAPVIRCLSWGRWLRDLPSWPRGHPTRPGCTSTPTFQPASSGPCARRSAGTSSSSSSTMTF